MHKVIGLIGGGFKPLTKGHYFLIESAAKECDHVHVFVSTKGRERPGELSILWSDMEQVWKQFLEKAMPKNVSIEYSPAPVGNIMGLLKRANADSANNNTYIIYTDVTDLEKNFPARAKEKYMNRLLANDQIIFKGFKRQSGLNISGTMMRQYLERGNLKAFIEGLPKPVRIYGPEIFRILGGKSEV